MNNRYSAFFVHIIMSALVLITVYMLTRMVWYPSYFYDLDGGFEATKVVFLVDLVLGPMMTLFIYKPKKKGLLFDLSCIGLIQVLALAYGVSLLYNFRPVAMVVQNQTFFSVTADVYKNYEVNYHATSSDDSIALCGLDCYMIEDSYDSRTSIMTKGTPARMRLEFYNDYAKEWSQYSAAAYSFFDVSTLEDEQQLELLAARDQLLATDANINESDLGFLPIYGRYLGGYFLVHKKSGKILLFIEQAFSKL